MRICKDCGIEKPLSEFHKNGISKVTGNAIYRGRCRKCHNLKFHPPKEGPNLGRFKKGHATWNKNTKGLVKANSGSWKKGRDSWNKGKSYGRTRYCVFYEQWRNSVYERDNYACKKCFSTDRLQAHHIKPWGENTELRFEIDNGITLCNSCHAKLHCNIALYNKHKIPPWNKGLIGSQVAWNKGTKGLIKPNKGSFKNGYKMSEETKKKLSDANKGKVFSAEHRKKLSVAAKKRRLKITEEKL